MKVLAVMAPVSFGGGETLMINLLREKPENLNIDMALIYSSERFERELDKIGIKHYELTNKNIGHGIPRYKTLLNTIGNIFQIHKLGKIIKDNGYDIVHANSYPAVFMVSHLKKCMNFKCVYTHHSIRSNPTKIEKKIFTSWYSSYDVCTAVSESAAESMNEGFPNNKNNFITIYNCIAGYYFKLQHNDKNLFGHDRVNFVQVARFTDIKNQECIVSAVEKLSKEYQSKIRVIFVGDGYNRQKTENLVKEKGLQDFFVFTGAKEPEEIPEILDSCDFGLMPSRAEGFGLGAVECMSRGLPVLASDIPVLKEIVGEAGYIKSFDRFDEAFIEALRDGDKKKGAAIKRASNFKPEIIINQYVKLYQNLMKK